MIKYFCDKCHEEIKGDICCVTFSRISEGEYSTDVLFDKSGLVAIENPMLCEKCKDKVISFIYCGGYFL